MKVEFNRRFMISGLLLFLVVIIFFEASQQLFYIQQFDLENGSNIRFSELLKNQFFRWVIWLLLTIPLFKFIKNKSQKRLTKIDLLLYVSLIVGLVFISILLISLLRIFLDDNLNFSELFENYIPFYLYQKGLVFTFGYTVVVIVLHLFYTSQKLQIQVTELSEVKKMNAKLYQKLRKEIQETSSVLTIKIGNKHKIIPIKNINWIEADDYCVKIHTDNQISYSMRSSLKSMEDKLNGNNFLRVHRNALVNMHTAKELDFSNTPKLILTDNTEITISKSKVKNVRDFMS